MDRRNILSMLMDEPPLVVAPSLALTLGLEKALFLQQLHYWMNRSSKIIEGKRWVYNTIKDWHEQFPFWSESTIRRIIENLEKDGLIISDNHNKWKADRTKWYTIDYDKLSEIELQYTHVVNLSSPSAQNEQMDCSNWTNVASAQNEQSNTHKETTAESTTARSSSKPSRKKKALKEVTKTEQQTEQQTPIDSSTDPKKITKHIAKKNLGRYEKNRKSRGFNTPTELVGIWRNYLTDYEWTGASLSFTMKEKKCIEKWNQQLEGTRLYLGSIFEYVIANWSYLRGKFTTGNGKRKQSKLPEEPSFMDAYYLREDITREYSRNPHPSSDSTKSGSSKGALQTFTKISEVPKDHPHYKMIVDMIKTTGKAELV